MIDTLYALLSHWWGSLAIALIVGTLGWIIVRVTRGRGGAPLRYLGYAVGVAALLLAAGSVVGIVRVARAERGYPPPGKLVDVGGFRMHILAEGDAKGGPTLIWIPGSHAQGAAFHNFQKAMRGETRTILFDRPGTGWSDPGPFPRRTAREAQELATLLDKSGERGPFILIGHSYGGLLAANYARRHPERTAAVVLLDATPPDAFIYPLIFGEGAAKGLVSTAKRSALKKVFGLWSAPDRAPRGATASRISSLQDTLLADVRGAMDARSARPAGDLASASIFEEFTAGHVSRAAPELVVYDGELGDLPLYVVIPEGDVTPMIQAMPLSDEKKKRSLNFFVRSRVRYMQASSRAELLHPPAGSSHNYPYEHPEFVLGVVRRALAAARGSGSTF